MKTAILLAALMVSWIQPAMADEDLNRGPASLVTAVELKREAIQVAPEEFQGPTNLLPDVEIDLAGIEESTPEQ